ncbi:MAG: hypothetical protein LUF04_09870 [Bacteroides sp.]|nr:hypothetical protein [Bacteroides sp.]
MAVILNLAVAVVLLAGMYAIGRKNGYGAAWAEVRDAVEEAESWQALAETLEEKAEEADP